MANGPTKVKKGTFQDNTKIASLEHLDARYSTYVGGRTKIGRLLLVPDGGKSLIGKTLTFCGWVRSCRDQKGTTFLAVNDGSCDKDLQAVVSPECPGFDLIKNFDKEKQLSVNTGASVKLTGEVVKSPAKGQEVELKMDGPGCKVEVLGIMFSG